MTTQPQSSNNFPKVRLLRQKAVDGLFEKNFHSYVPLNKDLPVRKAVLTYLLHLDRRWSGGWSWQWPLVIAGPSKGGKTQLAYQLIASSLLSFHSPWKIAYSDLAGDYRPERIQKILGWRKQGSPLQWQLGRIEKNTLYRESDFYQQMKWNANRPDLALWVIDAFEHLGFHKEGSFAPILQLLGEFSRRRNVGVIVTIRGSLTDIRPLIPWSFFPYFLYITQKRYRLFHLRMWQKGVSENANMSTQLNQIIKIYDWMLNFYGYFQEVRWWDQQQKVKKRPRE
jgi:hypothetical protein